MTPATLALWAALALVPQTSAPTAGGDDERELRRLESIWNDAHVTGDADALDRLWDEDLVVTVPGMTAMSKASSLAIWRTGRMRFARYATDGVVVRVHGDAAVVTGRIERQRVVEARTHDDAWLFTKIYVRKNGEWRVVAWHASPPPAP